MEIFIAVMLFLIVQRLAELRISSANYRRLMSEGGVEYGSGHYIYIVLLHTMFIISMLVEYYMRYDSGKLNDISYLFLVFFALLQAFRFWIIKSLGKYWNTRIVRVPGSELVRTGPYRFFKHPNYIVVALEIFCIPMIFGLYYTAVVFTILNSVMLTVRIREENKVLKQ